MDVHSVDVGTTVDAVVAAHRAGLQASAARDVRFLRYWVDEERGQVFCLAEAASTADVQQAHAEDPRRHREIFRVQEVC
ncbi:MAG TPA: nickel-binding protein [Candidatus Nanopelagicales bacterium]|nr:nickel-binding protein [Candidatus Nanopelagicales bacterium]